MRLDSESTPGQTSKVFGKKNEERSAAVSNVLCQVGRARKGGKFKI
jgi:hypothetical protein